MIIIIVMIMVVYNAVHMYRAKDYETTAHSAKQNVQLKTRFR